MRQQRDDNLRRLQILVDEESRTKMTYDSIQAEVTAATNRYKDLQLEVESKLKILKEKVESLRKNQTDQDAAVYQENQIQKQISDLEILLNKIIAAIALLTDTVTNAGIKRDDANALWAAAVAALNDLIASYDSEKAMYQSAVAQAKMAIDAEDQAMADLMAEMERRKKEIEDRKADAQRIHRQKQKELYDFEANYKLQVKAKEDEVRRLLFEKKKAEEAFDTANANLNSKIKERADMEAKISALLTAKQEITDKISRLRYLYQTLEAQKAQAEQDLQDAEARLAAVRDQLATLRIRLDKARIEWQKAKKELDEFQASLKDGGDADIRINVCGSPGRTGGSPIAKRTPAQERIYLDIFQDTQSAYLSNSKDGVNQKTIESIWDSEPWQTEPAAVKDGFLRVLATPSIKLTPEAKAWLERKLRDL